MLEKGFCLSGSNHPIIPVIVEDAVLAKQMADELNKRGIFVVNFSFPVVPKNKARIRIQISSSHTKENLDYFRSIHIDASKSYMNSIKTNTVIDVIEKLLK